MKVRNMPRDQQKAVFARLGEGSRLEGTEAYTKRHESMIKKSELAENTEDKIWKVMDNNKLTYRQKMIEVAKIKRHALKQFPTQVAGAADTGALPAAPRSFQKKKPMIGITSVPKGLGRQSFDSILIKKKLGKSRLFEHEGLLLTQKEYAIARKRAGHKLPEGARITEQPAGIKRSAFNSILMRRKPDKNLYIKVDGLTLSAAEYRKAVKRNARVRYGARGWTEKHKLEEALARKEAKKDYAEKGIEPPGVRAIYEKTLIKKDNKGQEKVYWKNVRPEDVKLVHGHYEANNKLIFWHGAESANAQQALRKANLHHGRSPWETVSGYSRFASPKDKEKQGGKIEPPGVRAIYEKTLAKKKDNYKRVKAQEEGNVIYWFENEKGGAISYVNAGTAEKPEYEIRQTYKGARQTIKSPLGSTFRASPEKVLEMSTAHAQRRGTWAQHKNQKKQKMRQAEAATGELKAQKMYKKERGDHPKLPAKAVKTIVHDHMKKEGWEHNSPWKKKRNKKTPAQRAVGAVSGYLGQKLYERYSPEGRRKKAEEKLSHIKRVERAEQAEKQAKQAESERVERRQKEQAGHRRMQAEQAEKREERKIADERHRKEYAERHPGEKPKRFGLF